MDKISECVTLSMNGEIAVISVDNPPVNAISAAVRSGIADALNTALTSPEASAIILICKGRSFFAGADITEFGRPVAEPSLRQLNTLLENASKPVIAAIHGTALGGGLELAMAAHFRLAVPSARCGLPEVHLGLLPGGGGTQRLPRLVGVKQAIDMMVSGDPLSAAAAVAAGLLNSLAGEECLQADTIAFARRVIAEARPFCRTRDLEEKLEEARRDPQLIQACRADIARRHRGYEAPERIIACVERALASDLEEGLNFETEQFRALEAGSQSAALRHLFFAERQAVKEPELDEAPPMKVQRVGIVGAGTMGGGIAMTFLDARVPVVLVDTDPAGLDRGMATIRRNYEATVSKGRLSREECQARLTLLKGTLDLHDLAPCDLIIEAVFENLNNKKNVFTEIGKIASREAIVASNTSYLDIDVLAAQVPVPDNVLGLHFFAPANVMRLLEIVRGSKTSKRTLITAIRLAKTVGKMGVVVGNAHGFVGNRMLTRRSFQAERLLEEGAMPWDVDRVMYDFGFPMGPLAMRDLVGLDVGWTKDTSCASTIREVLNEMGRHGQKSGSGYYDYDEQRRGTPSPVAEQVILEFSARKGFQRRKISDDEILERCLYPIINEGAKILDEKIARNAADIDVIWANGYGWPRYKGGPMFWADLVGLPLILSRLTAMTTLGEAFRPAPLLERLVSENRSFRDL